MGCATPLEYKTGEWVGAAMMSESTLKSKGCSDSPVMNQIQTILKQHKYYLLLKGSVNNKTLNVCE